MSRLISALPLTLALVSFAEVARGDVVSGSSGRRWDFDSRLGYGASWTTAQSYLGFGTGLAGGVTFRIPVHIEIGAMYSAGSRVSAANESFVYGSRDWSMLTHAAVGYELTFARHLVVRPHAIVGGVFIVDSMRLGDLTRHDLESIFVLGPGTAVLARFAGFHAGVDAHALFVPSRVAAPIGALYAVFGLEI
jgi:hypothetical protein